jgi:hypothetical protein
MNTKNNLSFNSWWGRHPIDSGRTDFWQIGPLNLWTQHLPKMWKLSWHIGSDWLDSRIRCVPGVQAESISLNAQHTHCALNEPQDDIIFSPVLADRPLVTRLTTPLFVLPNESINVYILSPLWLRIELSKPNKKLHELPIFRLSDTWFGPVGAGGGMLCYANSTTVFLDIRDVPLRLHCATTAVTIRNSASSNLCIDRINIPCPNLSLFYSSRTGFWTDSVTMERNEATELANIKFDRQPPADAAPTQFVAAPRQTIAVSSPVFRSFSALFDRHSGKRSES